MAATYSEIEMNTGLLAHVAEYHIAQGNPDVAHALLSARLVTPPSTPREREALAAALCNVANAYLRGRAVESAVEALRSAEMLADTVTVWRAAAALADLKGERTKSVELWQRVTRAQPQESVACLALARAYEAAGHVSEAIDAYLKVVQLDRRHATVLSIARRLEALAPLDRGGSPPQQVRIAIIGSSTLDHMRSYLEVDCRIAGLSPTFYLGAFDQYTQEILDPGSGLYGFAPEVIILNIHGRSIFPDLYDDALDGPVAARREAVDEVVRRMSALLAQITAQTQSIVLLHTFATPQYSPLGILDWKDGFGQTALFAAINDGLAETVRRDFPSVWLVDEDRVYGRIGKQNVTDPRLWSLARIGLGPAALDALSSEYMRVVKALKGRTRKCLVLDLDNTLWGGIVGEDGLAGIAIGHDAPGNAFRAFQEAILSLWRRGIILAINSKNNERDALEALERHPDMILRPHHFAAMRINWLDKASNLESIAAELNIGLDSVVFMDDNPTECHLVRTRLPQVLTVELPRDATRYRALLLEMTDFETLSLTEEDRRRGQLYAQRRERVEWEARHAENLDAYLADLGLEVDVFTADDFAIPRVAQLINKTNQFNLTTHRYTEVAVRALCDSDHHRVYGVRVRDRFGDHGLVGAAILEQRNDVWAIDTFLLSCRVLGRGVETALLSAVVKRVRAEGGRYLHGLFVPTEKNAPARDFYERHGFHLLGQDTDVQEWQFDVEVDDVPTPPWLTLHATPPLRDPVVSAC